MTVETNAEAEVLTFDGYLKSTIGEFGLYQFMIVMLLCVPACFVCSWGDLDLVFIAYTPKHVCNDTFISDDYANSTSDISTWHKAKQCSIIIMTDNDTLDMQKNCKLWIYDSTYFEKTVVTQWNLVCDRAIVIRTIVALYNLATLINPVYSYIQDRWGRKRAFIINLTVHLLGNCGSLLSTNPAMYAVMKFISGITCLWKICYCWATEFVGPSHRTTVTALLALLYALASASLGLVAFLSRTWIQVGFVTSVPFVLLYLYFILVPESPRWLISQGRLDEACKIIETMAKWNKVTIDHDEVKHQVDIMARHHSETTTDNHVNTQEIKEFFRSKNLRYKMIMLIFLGSAVRQLYQAVPFNLENLQGNLIAAFVLQALVEAPVAGLNFVILNRVGRILPLSLMLFLSSICCFLTWPFDTVGQYGAIIFAAFSRFFIAGAFEITEQLENELYPTVGRGVGNAIAFIFYALFNALAQYVIYSSTVWNVLPLIIMGGLMFFASGVSLFLPETKGLDLPDNVEQAESQGSVGWISFKSHFQWLLIKHYIKKSVLILQFRTEVKNPV